VLRRLIRTEGKTRLSRIDYFRRSKTVQEAPEELAPCARKKMTPYPLQGKKSVLLFLYRRESWEGVFKKNHLGYHADREDQSGIVRTSMGRKKGKKILKKSECEFCAGEEGGEKVVRRTPSASPKKKRVHLRRLFHQMGQGGLQNSETNFAHRPQTQERKPCPVKQRGGRGRKQKKKKRVQQKTCPSKGK